MTKRKGTIDEPCRSTRFRKGRRPHNARKSEDVTSMDEIVTKVGAELTRATISGREVQMCRLERSFRLAVDRALAGNRRDLVAILKLILKHPELSASYRYRTVIYLGGLA